MAKIKQNENIKEKILEKTAELISQHGVKSTSLADISKNVGISKGTLYYYYKTKEDIIFDLADIYITKIIDDIFESLDDIGIVQDSTKAMKLVFEKLISAQTRSRFHLYLVVESITDNEKFKEKYKNIYLQWRHYFKTKLDEHFKLNLDYEILSRVLLSLVDGLLIQNLLGIKDNNLEEMFDLILR